VVTLITLTGGFRVIKATLDDLSRLTRGARNAVGPAQLADGLITLHIIDEILNVDLHGWTPVRDRGMRCRQYTPSSNATTPESNKSAQRTRDAQQRSCYTPFPWLPWHEPCHRAWNVRRGDRTRDAIHGSARKDSPLSSCA